MKRVKIVSRFEMLNVKDWRVLSDCAVLYTFHAYSYNFSTWVLSRSLVLSVYPFIQICPSLNRLNKSVLRIFKRKMMGPAIVSNFVFSVLEKLIITILFN